MNLVTYLFQFSNAFKIALKTFLCCQYKPEIFIKVQFSTFQHCEITWNVFKYHTLNFSNAQRLFHNIDTKHTRTYVDNIYLENKWVHVAYFEYTYFTTCWYFYFVRPQATLWWHMQNLNLQHIAYALRLKLINKNRKLGEEI